MQLLSSNKMALICRRLFTLGSENSILQPKEREVDVEVNGCSVELRMVLDDNGTAYFMPPIGEAEATGLSASTSSLVNNASSTEDIADILAQDDPEDIEVNQIFSSNPMPSQVLSEPEQSPISSPIGSRPQSPSAKSDSEANTKSNVPWTVSDPHKLREKGMFLDELAASGEALLPLYLGSAEKDNDDDVESGRGVSMPQSPQPPSAINRMQDMLPNNGGMSQDTRAEIALSLCGPLVSADYEISLDEFQQYRISWEAFERDPLRHISNLDLFVWNLRQDTSSGAKIKCMPWSIYSAQLAAHCAFGREFQPEQMSQLLSRSNAERSTSGGTASSSWFRSFLPKRTKAPATAALTDRALRPNNSSDNILLNDSASKVAFSQAGSSPNALTMTTTTPPIDARPTGIAPSVHARLASDVRYATDDDEDDALFQIPRNVSLTHDVARATNSAGKERRHPPARRRGLSMSSSRPIGQRRTRRLTTEQVRSLGLSPGENTFAFSLSHQILGTTRLTCRVFVWRWDDRLIVSDIDGTITRSDVLGQVLPIMGYEWTQPGVSRLFSLLMKNNYKILYLSARAIGLAQQTRDYLSSIEGLPPGPLLLSPASLVNAFYKEVIERVPERFKINCLREIMKLFPAHRDEQLAPDDAIMPAQSVPHTPFYAGFGNRPNDAKAYRAVVIPPSRIFIINPRAEVRMDMGSYKSTYDTLAESADLFFPAYSKSSSPVHNQFNSFEYWRPKPDDE